MNAVQLRRLAQEVEDTYRRAFIGGLFYLAGYLVVAVYGGAFEREPAISWILVAVLVFLAGARMVRRPPKNGDAAQLTNWLWVHWSIVVGTTAIWGGVFVWVMSDPAFAAARPAALLCTLGLAIAIANAFSMRRGFALAGLGMLYVPGLVLLWRDPTDRATALVMSVYLAYVLITLLRSYVEYQQRLDLDQDLRDQRDLFARQSRIDPLTELANRRHFADILSSATRHTQATGEPLSMLLLDLDHFKRVNDTYGHAVGDACLIAVADRLKTEFFGGYELAARLGGEEFGVVLEGLDATAAAARAERFRASLVARPVEVNGSALPITVSIGVAEYDRSAQRNADDLYRAADRAVYAAKGAGRNQVCQDQAVLA